MSTGDPNTTPEKIEVDLREPVLAALLAWLWPGAGHLYQGRYRKGALFMICILGTFFIGMILGHGHVVYASWRPNDYRWQAIPQLGVGLPALPAIVQNLRVRDGGEPFMITARRFPEGYAKEYQVIPAEELSRVDDPLLDGLYAPPDGEIHIDEMDVLAMWTSETGHGFEIGTLYTIVAGLLNVLAIYDAFAGPVLPSEDEKKKTEGPGSDAETGAEEA